MRKHIAMTMVALLALTLALAVVSCGGAKTEDASTTTPATTTTETSAMPESASMDTSMAH